MSVKDCKPLPTACVKNLCDKLFEKRKAGAIEVEQLVKTFLFKNKSDEIEKIIQILGQDFIISPNSNTRKGGLIGLASVAIGLGQNSQYYTNQLIAPIFQALRDIDSQIRYAACEALFNILKVLQAHALPYLNDLFDALCTVVADSETSVRLVVGHCDRLLRDIVIQNSIQDVETFMNVVADRLCSRVPFTRKFVVGWISTLNSMPAFNIAVYIPKVLDGLLTILSDENQDIRRSCDILLSDFLSTIIRNFSSSNAFSMINILISHCQESTRVLAASSSDERTTDARMSLPASHIPPQRLRQITTLQWIRQFVLASTSAAGTDQPSPLLPLVAPILSAILACLDERDETESRSALKRALDINEELIKFVHSLSRKSAWNAGDTEPSDNSGDLRCSAILEVIYEAFEHPSVLTRLAALRWVEVLLEVDPVTVFGATADLMPLLLGLLSDSTVEVVHSTVFLVGCLFKHPLQTHAVVKDESGAPQCAGGGRASVQRLFSRLVGSEAGDREGASLLCLRFLYDLVRRFISHPVVLKEKGSLIMTDLCLALGARSVYYVMALIVSNLLQPRDAFMIVHMLNQILLTQPAILTFREYLHNIDLNKDADLFEELYRAWCHNPVALLALCLLTQNYTHCRKLIKHFGELAMSVEVLTELDCLIQLIESPVFGRLRLHMVDKRYSADLQDTLYCMLMCLPQTEAFDTLRRRLQCLPSHLRDQPYAESPPASTVDFDALLEHFRKVQATHYRASVQAENLATGSSAGSEDARSGTSDNTVAPISVELGFVRSEIEGGSQLLANSTQFLVQGLQKLRIEAVSPKDSTPS